MRRNSFLIQNVDAVYWCMFIMPLSMKILVAPCLYIVEDGQEAFPKLGQCILNPWGYLTEIPTGDEAISLQFTKLLCKRTFRNLPNLTAQLSEAPDITFADISKKLNFIFPAQQFLYGRNCFAAIHSGF